MNGLPDPGVFARTVQGTAPACAADAMSALLRQVVDTLAPGSAASAPAANPLPSALMFGAAGTGLGLVLVVAWLIWRRRRKRRRPLFMPGDRIEVGGRTAIVDYYDEIRQRLVYRWEDDRNPQVIKPSSDVPEVEPETESGPGVL